MFADDTNEGGKYRSGRCTMDEKNGMWRITFLPRNQKDETPIKERQFKFADSLLPKYPKVVKAGDERKYLINIKFGEDKNIEEVLYIRPLKWVDELMKIVDISRENFDPQGTPTFYEYHWQENPEEYWIDWIMEFVEGEYQGCRVPLKVKYLFAGGDDGKAVFTFSKKAYDYEKSVRIHQFVHFYHRQLGIMNFPPENDPTLDFVWPEDGNLAPDLFGRAMDKGLYFRTNGDGKRYIEYSDVEVVPAPAVEEPVPDESLEDVDQMAKQDEAVDDNDW